MINNKSFLKIFNSNAGKYIFPALLLLVVQLSAQAQKPTTPVASPANKVMSHADSMAYKASVKRVNVLSADQIKQFVGSDSVVYQSFVGHAKLKQETTYFEADSIILNSKTQFAEAFGHVFIDDDGKSKIHSDYLRYDGTTKKAFFNGNVRLNDKTSKLSTPSLDYDMNTKTSVYNQTGHLVSDKTVLDSKGGVYSSITKDATFTGDVKLRNPQYNIDSDTLLYNAQYDSVTFVSPTTIYDGPFHRIYTKDGYYNLKTKQAYFGFRPTIIDSTSTLIADEVATDRLGGYSEARGNVFFKDTSQGMVLVSQNLKTNETDKSMLATINPVAIVKQNTNDSLYIGGDTIYSARLSDKLKSGDSTKFRVSAIFLGDRQTTDSAKVIRPGITYNPAKAKRMIINHVVSDGKDFTTIDSVMTKPPMESFPHLPGLSNGPPDLAFQHRIDSAKLPLITPKLMSHNDSLFAKLTDKNFGLSSKDSAIVARVIDSAHATIDSLGGMQKVADSLTILFAENKEALSDSAFISHADSFALPKIVAPATQKILPNGQSVASKTKKTSSNTKKSTSQADDDNHDRYIEVYRGVRIFSDSLQAASDSLFYSFQDSLFRLYKNPVVWTKENQLVGDTIYMYTANKKPKRIFVWNNGVIVSKVDSVESRPYYNQVKGKTIDARFTDGKADSMIAKGNAENVYYLMDEKNRYIAGNKGNSNEIRTYFSDGHPSKIVMVKNVQGSIYPMRSVSLGEMQVRGYRLDKKRRPMSKYDILNRDNILVDENLVTKETEKDPESAPDADKPEKKGDKPDGKNPPPGGGTAPPDKK